MAVGHDKGVGLPRVGVLVLLLTLRASAATYYVSSSRGSDVNLGLAGAPWQTMARVNRARFLPGDVVLFRREDAWRETLRPGASGAEGRVIRFGAYGSGHKPVISGRDLDSGPIVRDTAIDNNHQSHVVYQDLELRDVRQGLRVYSWSGQVEDVTLQDCDVSTGPSESHGTMSAGVYASVNRGSISALTIRNNRFTPYPRGLEHWGVYLVRGVSNFVIDGNRFGPAGEDAITVWHAEHGVIVGNSGGGNGENTIDVKDSHDIVVQDNKADGDLEYNVVVHAVDTEGSTYNVTVEGNQCRRAGRGGHLDAGIVLLSTRDSVVNENSVSGAYGAGIFVLDGAVGGGNEVSFNKLRNNAVGRPANAISLKDVREIKIHDNHGMGNWMAMPRPEDQMHRK